MDFPNDGEIITQTFVNENGVELCLQILNSKQFLKLLDSPQEDFHRTEIIITHLLLLHKCSSDTNIKSRLEEDLLKNKFSEILKPYALTKYATFLEFRVIISSLLGSF